MSEILDEIENKGNASKRFSILSLLASSVTINLCVLLVKGFSKIVRAGEGIYQPSILLIYAIGFFCLFGVVMTILSIVKKEPSSWSKWIGGILNILLFFLLLGTVIFADLIDTMRY